MSRRFKPLFMEAARDHGVSPRLLSAIVFPELIRYHRFRDLAETAVVEQAYVRFGKETADFSIGAFQMKPSFVESLELQVRAEPVLLSGFLDITRYGRSDSAQIRQERVRRLQDMTWQVRYLACFTRIMETRRDWSAERPESEKVRLLASAYNMGLSHSIPDFERHAQDKTFPYGRMLPTGFSYADVSDHFYRMHSMKLF